ncbi:MAG: iron ABC transporter permease [Phototrophicaceae bacterium]
MANNSLNLSESQSSATMPRLNLGISWLPIIGMGIVLTVIFVFVLMMGSVKIPLIDVITVLLGGEASKDSWTTIVLQVRLPKALTAVLAGSALGISGLMMQTFFRNPLAGPFILGISSGASLGVALVVLSAGTIGGVVIAGFGLMGDLALAISAGLGAGLTMLIVLLIAHQVRNSMTLLILGLMFGYFTSAIVSILLYFAVPERIQSYIRWTFGTFGGTTWSQISIFAPLVIVGLIGAFSLSKTLNALLLGETYARSMGLNVNRARIAIIGFTAILAGTVTAFCGPIGFIGIAVPHLCRSLLGTSDHRALIPATVIMGAIVALVSALIAEMPGNQITLPLNAVTSLLGAPVVMWVILRRRNLNKTFAS